MPDIAELLQEHTTTIETKFGEQIQRLGELGARVDEIEQKAARRPGFTEAAAVPSWGADFTERKSADLEQLASQRGRVSLEMKTSITSAADSGGGLIVPTRDSTVSLPRRRLTIRDLLTVINVSTGTVEYPRQVARPNAAGMVAEGALKPEAAATFELANAPIRTIAHWIPASRQVLEDAPQLAGMIDVDLRYGLAVKEEEQLLFGSGVGQNLTGMATLATAYAPPIVIAGANMIDKIGLAILQSSLTDVPPDGIVVHPSDWWAMRLLKDADGKYILGDPGADVSPRLFGLPVVPTQAMTIDKFLVGGFAAQTLYDRWTPRVEVSTEHADFFTRNMVAILAEERIGFAAKQPQALIFGDFGNVA